MHRLAQELMPVIEEEVKMARFVINVDDYGISDQEDARIVSLIKKGRVSSVSVFCTTGRLESAAQKLRPFFGMIDIGVHLDLTHGTKVGAEAIPTFSFDSTEAPIKKIAQLNPELVRSEFEAQIAEFESHFGRPTHLDNHRPEIYFFPELFAVTLELAARMGIFVRTPFNSAFASKVSSYSLNYGLDEEFLQQIGEKSLKKQSDLRVKHLHNFEIIGEAQRSVEGIEQIARNSAGILTEVCCHAGINKPEFLKEYELLMSDVVEPLFGKVEVVRRP